jgi:hypothetical protein
MASSSSQFRARVSNRTACRWLIVACATCWALLPAIAFCDDRVSGTLTAKGKAVELKHVYTFWKSRLLDETKMDIHLLLSDQIIAPDCLPANDAGIAKMAELVRDDKVHALELHFAGATNKLFEGEQGAIYHNAIAAARQGITGMLQYRSEPSAASAIAGSVSVDKEFLEILGWSCRASLQVALPAKHSDSKSR